MSTIVESIRAEYTRYKALGEGAIAQVADAQLGESAGANGNSIATIVWHLSGNFASRFTDFLTTDGEKPWRNREEEFTRRVVSRDELSQKWEQGWRVLLAALDQLSDADLTRSVIIRRQSHLVHEALHRSLAHAAYHVGQIVLLARVFQGEEWKYLSIPPGGSDAYNQTPTNEHGSAHAAALRRKA
ncbi:MAG: DUF1572 domain-containing protein [Acidobacteria bacterium]|nr:DUF1572 domain-containing protein [Acidobacteriota bacterium]